MKRWNERSTTSIATATSGRGDMQPYEQLEIEWKCWIGEPDLYTVAVSSGTTALHVALEAMGLPMASRVIVPEFTMIACARAVSLAGLTPTPVDVGNDLLLSTDGLRSIPSVAAVMPVHVYGRRCDVPGVKRILGDVRIVEDCAEFHGATLSGIADAYCWSFYQNKIVAGEEGGIIAFVDRDHAKTAREIRCQGFTQSHDFMHRPRGVNARISNANAALILDSLQQADEHVTRRRQVERWYDQYMLMDWRMPRREVPWVYDVLLPPGTATREVVRQLNAQDVAARLGFRPISAQPEYWHHAVQHTNADRLSRRVIYLPVKPDMTEHYVRHVCRLLQELVDRVPLGA